MAQRDGGGGGATLKGVQEVSARTLGSTQHTQSCALPPPPQLTHPCVSSLAVCPQPCYRRTPDPVPAQGGTGREGGGSVEGPRHC